MGLEGGPQAGSSWDRVKRTSVTRRPQQPLRGQECTSLCSLQDIFKWIQNKTKQLGSCGCRVKNRGVHGTPRMKRKPGGGGQGPPLEQLTAGDPRPESEQREGVRSTYGRNTSWGRGGGHSIRARLHFYLSRDPGRWLPSSTEIGRLVS